MTLNETVRDLELRHHVGIQRLSSALIREIIELLDRADQEIAQELRGRSATLEGSFTSQRLKYLLTAIREINQEANDEIARRLRDGLVDLSRYEAEFQARLLTRALPGDTLFDVVSPALRILDAVVTSEPLNGELLRDMVTGLSRNKFARLKQAIQLGIIEGQTSEQIVRRITGTAALKFRDGVMQISRLSAERLVRTATNHVANAAREKLFVENKDIVKEVQWVATLDTRTCPTCGALDGQTFKLGVGPRPPRHINCRCTIVPVMVSWRQLGIDIDELPPLERASMNGQVSGTETFQTWLKRQSAQMQDEALGPTRGLLFRKGKLAITRFVDARGNHLTLEELRSRESKAFRRAKVA